MKLKKKLKSMIVKHGKIKTRKILKQEIQEFNVRMRQATNIYIGLEIEHEILDREAMLRWLEEDNV